MQIADISQLHLGASLERFFLLRDPAVRNTVFGMLFLGLSSGMLGSHLILRRMALVGDALAHAVLPGVVAAYLWVLTKDPLALFLGAIVSGLLAAMMISFLSRRLKMRADSAMGIVLVSFFAVGALLLSYVQRLPWGSKSGLESFLFGQAAALSEGDLWLMGLSSFFVFGCLFAFRKEYLLWCFDPSHARLSGYSLKLLDTLFMFLLTLCLVIGLRAVGVVLISALLVTPAATASLMSRRFFRVLTLSVLLAMLGGLSGAFLSYVGNGLPTGPLIVLSSSVLFGLVFLFAPKRGYLIHFYARKSREQRTRRENALKGLYQILEKQSFARKGVAIREYAAFRSVTLKQAHHIFGELARAGYVSWIRNGEISLTPEGWLEASRIVRNHRLWELYLTHVEKRAPSEVHEEAETIEHILSPDMVVRLEKLLQYPLLDPHGQKIPSLEDMRLHL